jgi:hypothetical protein
MTGVDVHVSGDLTTFEIDDVKLRYRQVDLAVKRLVMRGMGSFAGSGALSSLARMAATGVGLVSSMLTIAGALLGGMVRRPGAIAAAMMGAAGPLSILLALKLSERVTLPNAVLVAVCSLAPVIVTAAVSFRWWSTRAPARQ